MYSYFCITKLILISMVVSTTVNNCYADIIQYESCLNSMGNVFNSCNNCIDGKSYVQFILKNICSESSVPLGVVQDENVDDDVKWYINDNYNKVILDSSVPYLTNAYPVYSYEGYNDMGYNDMGLSWNMNNEVSQGTMWVIETPRGYCQTKYSLYPKEYRDPTSENLHNGCLRIMELNRFHMDSISDVFQQLYYNYKLDTLNNFQTEQDCDFSVYQTMDCALDYMNEFADKLKYNEDLFMSPLASCEHRYLNNVNENY